MLEFFHNVITLFKKEVRVILKDRRNRAILIMPILIQSLIFGYVASFDLNRVTYAVWDGDGSAASRDLLAEFDGSGIFQRHETLENSSRIADILDKKKALVVLSIPPGFERDLFKGKTVSVQVLVDGRNGNVAGNASGYASTIIENYNTQRLGSNSSSVSLETRSWFNPNQETRWNFISGMLVILTVVQVLLLSSLTVSREKEQGSFDQLLVTPFSPMVLLIGKALPVLCVGIFQAVLVLVIALGWFHIPFSGDYFLLFSGLALFNLSIIGVGLCISTITSTMQQSMLYAFSLIVTLMLLSGFISPISSMPQGLQYLTLCNPVRYGVEIAQRIYLQGAGISELYLSYLALGFIACLTMGAASRLFRNRF